MKKTIFFAFLLLVIYNVKSQGTLFDHSNYYDVSSLYYVTEYNGYYYIGGFGTNYSSSLKAHSLLYKMDSWGNVVDSFSSTDTNLNYIFHIDFPDAATIRLFVSYSEVLTTKLLIMDLNHNFDIVGKKYFTIEDTAHNFGKEVLIDHLGNYVVLGGIFPHTYYPNYSKYRDFMLKISQNLDSVGFYKTNYLMNFSSLSDLSLNNQYIVLDDIYTMYYFDYDFNLIKSLRIDTGWTTFNYHYKLNDTAIAIIGYKNGLYYSGYDPDYQILFIKTMDSIGNLYNYYIVDNQDSVTQPSEGNTVTQNNDSSSLFFVWLKSGHEINPINNPERNFIGIGKFDLNLNPQWIKYYGKDSMMYWIYSIASTSDDGLIVTGFYQDIELSHNGKYFILKVDSLGECTFMKELPFSIPNIKVYPNPTTTHITIDWQQPNAESVSLQIFSSTGRLVQSFGQVRAGQELSVVQLSSGVYLLEGLTAKGQRFVGKFVKE